MSSSLPNVRIESAALADVDTLVNSWVALARDQRAYDSHLEPGGNRTQIRESFAHHIIGDGVLVARDDLDEIVGFVMFGLEQGDYAKTVTRGVVHNIFVDSSHRGRGLGSALLERAEAALSDRDADVISLEVMATNNGARRFYERHGYHPHRVELEKSAQSDTHSKEDG